MILSDILASEMQWDLRKHWAVEHVQDRVWGSEAEISMVSRARQLDDGRGPESYSKKTRRED